MLSLLFWLLACSFAHSQECFVVGLLDLQWNSIMNRYYCWATHLLIVTWLKKRGFRCEFLSIHYNGFDETNQTCIVACVLFSSFKSRYIMAVTSLLDLNGFDSVVNDQKAFLRNSERAVKKTITRLYEQSILDVRCVCKLSLHLWFCAIFFCYFYVVVIEEPPNIESHIE